MHKGKMKPLTKSKKVLNPKAVILGARIRTLREQKGFTQAELAAMLDVTENAVTQYETGRAVPKSERLQILAASLGVSVEWLLTGGDPDETVRAQTKLEKEGLAAIRALPIEHQPAAIAAIRGMLEAYTKK